MEAYENTLHDKPVSPSVTKYNLKKYNIEKHIQSKGKNLFQEITYENYITKKINLAKCKLPELKSAAKQYKLHISGKKGLLIERLTNYYHQTTSVIKIQSVYRMWLAIQHIRLRGPAVNDRTKCVNDTDFSTLEPINEIPENRFFSYKDSNDFTYGFDITSLMELMRQNVTFQNPYNREVFNTKTKKDIIALYKISCLLVPKFKEETIQYQHLVSRPENRGRNIRRTTNVYAPRINPMQTVEMFSQYEQINEIRNSSLSSRVSQVFIAIDRLGNYTSSEWFDSLDLRGYIRLYRHLYDIWYIRSGLTYETRSLICPYGCPFDGIFTSRILYSELTYDQIRTACVTVFENFVYSGVTEEYKTLGAFYSMSALTIVSPDARRAMPWLYEAVM